MASYSYDYGTLTNLFNTESRMAYGYGVTVVRGVSSVHIFYRGAQLATVTPLGVRAYRHPDVLAGGTAKKTLNKILREVGWAVVTRNTTTFLLHRDSRVVTAYSGRTLCCPDGTYTDVSTPTYLKGKQ